MKRLLFVLVGSALWLGMGATAAFADNGPHVTGAVSAAGTVNVSTDRCASCHRAHTAQGQYNLVNAQPDLCITCHGSDGTGASTDVVDGIGYTGADGRTPNYNRDGPTAALRGGGFKFALISSGNPTKDVYWNTTRNSWSGQNQNIPTLAAAAKAPTTSSHDVFGAEGTKYTAWGNGAAGTAGAGASIALECGSCHDPHGNGNYRILKPVPDASGAAAPGVTIPDAGAKVYVTTNYWLAGDSNVPLGGTTAISGTPGTGAAAPDGFIQNIAAWCTTCHTRYLAGSGSYKTDSTDPVFKYRHRSDVNSKQGGANCVTCHVAHGSNANMNGSSSSTVKLPDGSAAPVATWSDGSTHADSRLLRVDNRGICIMCHNV